ncbi:ParA family protein [Flavihumibacter rivuli]|uniref:ParA family protein n=1 Tax=Flavihumibacter rivuli TaxID=2838156 RepID=UPI001BDEE6AA|nr:ParA family protein [Flavihumibacter rivuli]ULQ55587.1 ParA family protein [Flavihumibacter rivuli]
MISIALYNLKGGVGKTASSVNFAYLAAQDGYKVLIWDLDPQGSASFYYNVQPGIKAGSSKLFSDQINLDEVIMATEYENISIIPADLTARNLDLIMEEMRTSKRRFKSILKQLEAEYDFVFIDVPPGFSTLSENIFYAVDIVLMPTIPTTLSVRTYQIVKDYFKDKELELSKLMCFFTMVDLRKNMHHEIMEELYRDKKFFSNYIPYLSDVEKMGQHQAPVHAFAPSSYAAQCYADLWEEIKEGVLE